MRILCIPDTQCKPGVPTQHLTWAGKAIVDYRPDVVVHLGDHWDMASLSSHDKAGSKYFEGKRYLDDIEAGNKGMDLLLQPLIDEQQRQRKNKEKVYNPRLVYVMGNHCNRINRAVNNNPQLEGLLTTAHFNFKGTKVGNKGNGWEVHPFLHPVFIGGVGFNHFWPVGALGRPASSASAIVSKLHQSCIAGHQQGKQIAYGKRADGKPICCIIAGSYYLHDEDYMDQLSNSHWRGLVMLNDVKDGTFDEMTLSIQYLGRKYG